MTTPTFPPGTRMRGRPMEQLTDLLASVLRTTGAFVGAIDPAISSTSYVDLATVGPSVTVVTATSAVVTLTTSMGSSGGALQYMSFAISGATTRAASDLYSLREATTSAIMHSASFLVSSLTPGSNTFTCKYRATAGTADFYQRHLIVQPLSV